MMEFFFCMKFVEEEKDKVEEDCRMLIAVCTAKHDVHIGHLSERVFAGHVQHVMMTRRAHTIL
jgi:hypothetical protein